MQSVHQCSDYKQTAAYTVWPVLTLAHVRGASVCQHTRLPGHFAESDIQRTCQHHGMAAMTVLQGAFVACAVQSVA